MDDTAKGYISVLIAVLLFGSFGSLVKSDAVQSRNVHPLVIQSYFAVAIFATSWLTASFEAFEFSWYGVLSGTIWTFCSLFSFVAIRFAGLGRAQGMWSGSSIVTSFVCGVVITREPLQSIGWAIGSVIVMLVGVACVAAVDAETTAANDRATGATAHENYENLEKSAKIGYNSDVHDGGGDGGRKGAIDDGIGVLEIGGSSANPVLGGSNFAVGIASSLITGVFNGSIMIPYTYNSVRGAVYVVSFSVGCLLTSFSALVLFFALRERRWPAFHTSVPEVPLRLLASGSLWNVGNVASIYATRYLGQAVGFSLTQLALLVGGLWGVLFFREITGARNLAKFAAGSACLMGGAAILGFLGKGNASG